MRRHKRRETPHVPWTGPVPGPRGWMSTSSPWMSTYPLTVDDFSSAHYLQSHYVGDTPTHPTPKSCLKDLESVLPTPVPPCLLDPPVRSVPVSYPFPRFSSFGLRGGSLSQGARLYSSILRTRSRKRSMTDTYTDHSVSWHHYYP